MATVLPSVSNTVALRPPPTASILAGLMPQAGELVQGGIEVGDGEGDQALPTAGRIDNDVEPGRLGHLPHHLVHCDLDISASPEDALEEVPAGDEITHGHARESDLDVHGSRRYRAGYSTVTWGSAGPAAPVTQRRPVTHVPLGRRWCAASHRASRPAGARGAATDRPAGSSGTAAESSNPGASASGRSGTSACRSRKRPRAHKPTTWSGPQRRPARATASGGRAVVELDVPLQGVGQP